ncbi:MAG: DUF4390 domain-containing protein [Nitrospinae bacterium]|nr:DUF4390 domain-containing protein [Nitrospinota bacterium]
MLSNTRKTFVLRKLVLAVCIIFALVAPALAATDNQDGIRVNDIIVINKNGQLLVFGSLLGAFTPKLLEAIHSGVTTKFIFDVSLLRSRKLIYDLEVTSRQLHHQVKYSALKKTYTFHLKEGEKEIERKVTKSQGEMTDWMRELNGAPIVTGKTLSPNSRYYVKIRARLNHVDFVFPFNYLLAFWGKQSDWSYSQTFSSEGM